MIATHFTAGDLGKVTIVCDRPGLAERVELCYNACAGLTTEQVAKIPEIINLSIKLRGALGKHGELSDILSKLAAFETMRGALEGMLTNIYPPGSAQDTNIEDSARAALKLVDDCEVTP